MTRFVISNPSNSDEVHVAQGGEHLKMVTTALHSSWESADYGPRAQCGPPAGFVGTQPRSFVDLLSVAVLGLQ